jgi:hypothetical protein
LGITQDRGDYLAIRVIMPFSHALMQKEIRRAMIYRTNRRRLMTNTMGLTVAGASVSRPTSAQDASSSTPVDPSPPEVVVSVARDESTDRPFPREDFGIVGVYDADWLVQPEFSMLLDNLAASPGAFHGGRFFGAFTAGTTELYTPDDGGKVWVDADESIDFSATFDALEALTNRGLVPFVVLGMFPPAISDSPIQPPEEWDGWKKLVRTFVLELAADHRFGADAIASWWFEAWNEPNEGRFWSGTEEEYFALYRATSDALAETGLSIRLGGPAIAYKPQENPDFGAPWMERFLRFIAENPDLKLDFVSLHRKGTVADDPPDPRRLHDAAATTAKQMLVIDPERFAGLTIINNEADEKVGFEVPYAPRVDERNAAWLAAVAAIHGGLGADYRDAGIEFLSMADNANLQLVEAPFDGRRSIMTHTTASDSDLLKVPAYGFYEMLRLLGDQHGEIVLGAEQVFPTTDLYHLVTVQDSHVGCLLTYYPHVGVDAGATRVVEYVVRDIPWERVNIGRFQIDRELSNAYAAAGGSQENPYPVPDLAQMGAIRQEQEIALSRPIARDVALQGGEYRERLEIAPYATLCLWITPVVDTVPEPPEWISLKVQDGNVILRWTPNPEPLLYSYEVFLVTDSVPGARLTPDPLRSALWVDTAPPVGFRKYGVRTISASGVESPLVISDEVLVG